MNKLSRYDRFVYWAALASLIIGGAIVGVTKGATLIGIVTSVTVPAWWGAVFALYYALFNIMVTTSIALVAMVVGAVCAALLCKLPHLYRPLSQR